MMFYGVKRKISHKEHEKLKRKAYRLSARHISFFGQHLKIAADSAIFVAIVHSVTSVLPKAELHLQNPQKVHWSYKE